MKRLSLAELKASSLNVIANLDAIKGGNKAGCHPGDEKTPLNKGTTPCGKKW